MANTTADAEARARQAGALGALVANELAFAASAHASSRQAFLAYLADDAWVLSPEPARGKPRYQAARENGDSLQWYPSAADIAPSGNFGFTRGGYVFTEAATGEKSAGSYMSVWKRDSNGRWQVVLDAGISHAAPTVAPPRLDPADSERMDSRMTADAASRLAKLAAMSAPDDAIRDFQTAVVADGFTGALWTYARNGDFMFYTDDEPPLEGAKQAGIYLAAHPISPAWQEEARDRSSDAAMLYTLGTLADGAARKTHVYVQIWQYDSKVANWGLRFLLINALPKKKTG